MWWAYQHLLDPDAQEENLHLVGFPHLHNIFRRIIDLAKKDDRTFISICYNLRTIKDTKPQDTIFSIQTWGLCRIQSFYHLDFFHIACIFFDGLVQSITVFQVGFKHLMLDSYLFFLFYTHQSLRLWERQFPSAPSLWIAATAFKGLTKIYLNSASYLMLWYVTILIV